jgi:cellulose synthase/poly-beta-1,6-N-acetylglucosamine synthase-like glycosyltransferase
MPQGQNAMSPNDLTDSTAAPPALSLEQTLVVESPRLTPRPVPLISRIIGASVVFLFFLLLWPTFFRQNLAAWSVGIAYIVYDTALLIFTASQIASLKRTPPDNGTKRSRPTLGIIIAARNEARVLGITIDRLATQSDPPDLILIADDGSTDETPERLAELYGLTPPATGELSAPAPKLPSLRWLRLVHGGKARALNEAFTHMETDLVLTVDADTLLDVNAVGAMRAAFAREPELVAATAVLTPMCGRSLSGRFFEWFQRYEYVRNFLSRYAWMRLDSLLLISGAFAAFRRSALIAVGGFDSTCLVEDYELIHRLHRHAIDHGYDWRVRVIGEAQALTDAPASLPAFMQQRRRWFGGFLQTQYWNRDMIGNKRFGRLGLAMMPVKTLDTLQPVFGLTAFAILVVFVALGKAAIALPIVFVMLAKIVVDMTFHLWSLGIYARWTGQREVLSLGPALLAALAEPFSFQLVRHAGAIWGWLSFLFGGGKWGPQKRTGHLLRTHR